MKLKAQNLAWLAGTRVLALLLAVSALLTPGRTWATGQLKPMTTSIPSGFTPGHMLLLTDGRIMVQQSGNAKAANNANTGGNVWQFLLPDSQGHYIGGSWSNCASMQYTREYYSSDVLPDGRVFVAGAEYGTGGLTAEVFDPVADVWTGIPVPNGLINTGPSGDAENSGFRDSESMLLANGTVMIAPVFYYNGNNTVIFDPASDTLSLGPSYLGSQNEVCWVKLPDGSILTVNKGSTSTERFIAGLNEWIADASTPVNLWATNGEIGSMCLLANGTVICFGGNNSSATAIYTPSGNTNNGSWAPGPNMPNGLVMRDCPSAVLNNGKVLVTLVATTNDQPCYLYEYDPNTRGFTLVFTDTSIISDATSMVEAPDGTVIFNDLGTVYIYQPDGSPVASGKPAVQSISYNSDGSLHLTGTLFNGISQGAMYGDDAQQDSNYPLVRFTDSQGRVYYGRTYNWSSTGVQTGNQVVTTECALPVGVLNESGNFSLQVVANGIASDSVNFPGPVWVNFNYTGSTQNGTFPTPFKTLAGGTNAVSSSGTVAIYANFQTSVSHETMTISKPMTIISVNGSSTIGH